MSFCCPPRKSNQYSVPSNQIKPGGCETVSGARFPVEYYQRFALWVLDLIRMYQQHPMFEAGMDKCHIIDYLKKQPTIDGDVESQVDIALQDLENKGFIMESNGSYRTLGPYAKLCSVKSAKQRRTAWEKIESNHSALSIPSLAAAKRSKNSTDSCNSCNTVRPGGSRDVC
ncbi:hypothetical protein ACFFRR_004443 [Megaselia abdita]